MKLAILDDYQDLALNLADWSPVRERCEIEVFRRNLKVPDEAAEALRDFDILCTMRERMAIPRALIERLPKLTFIGITGLHHRTLDLDAARERGIVVSHSTRRGSGPHATAELAWGLILALVRHLPAEMEKMRHSGWQATLGNVLAGKTLGVLGLGRLGSKMASIARAFDMEVIAWSQNLTAEAAAQHGAIRVEKDELFARSDILSIHVVLSERSRGLVGRRELGLMKPSARLVNTARGPIVDQDALIEALEAGRLAGAAVDVFEQEPLPDDHPLRRVRNLLLTPHLGYTVEELLRVFYEDTVENVLAYLDGAPIRIVG